MIDFNDIINAYKRELIIEALTNNDWIVKRAAESLSLKRTTLQGLVASLNIPKPKPCVSCGHSGVDFIHMRRYNNGRFICRFCGFQPTGASTYVHALDNWNESSISSLSGSDDSSPMCS